MDAQLAEFATVISLFGDWLLSHAASFIVGVIVLLIGWRASGFLATRVRAFLPRTKRIDATVAPLLAQLVRYSILIFTIVIALSQFGVETTSVLAILGAAGLAIALALQGTLSNIAAGVMMIWLRPFSLNDYIDGNGIAGTVVEIGLFSTQLRTADGIYLFVPNSQLWDAAITNYSREATRRLDIRCGISYDSDIATAREQMLFIANNDMRVSSDPRAVVYVDDLGDSSVVMLLRCWVGTTDYWDCKFEFTEKVKLAFDANDIEIPFNKLDINILRHPAPPADQTAGKSTGKPSKSG